MIGIVGPIIRCLATTAYLSRRLGQVNTQNDCSVLYPSHQTQVNMEGGYDQGGQTNQFATIATQEVPTKWSWCTLITSVFSVFCCQIFGIIAMVMSILSYVDHKTQDYGRSHSKRSTALVFAIAAIVIGTICISIAIILVAVAASEVTLASHYRADGWNK